MDTPQQQRRRVQTVLLLGMGRNEQRSQQPQRNQQQQPLLPPEYGASETTQQLALDVESRQPLASTAAASDRPSRASLGGPGGLSGAFARVAGAFPSIGGRSAGGSSGDSGGSQRAPRSRRGGGGGGGPGPTPLVVWSRRLELLTLACLMQWDGETIRLWEARGMRGDIGDHVMVGGSGGGMVVHVADGRAGWAGGGEGVVGGGNGMRRSGAKDGRSASYSGRGAYGGYGGGGRGGGGGVEAASMVDDVDDVHVYGNSMMPNPLLPSSSSSSGGGGGDGSRSSSRLAMPTEGLAGVAGAMLEVWMLGELYSVMVMVLLVLWVNKYKVGSLVDLRTIWAAARGNTRERAVAAAVSFFGGMGGGMWGGMSGTGMLSDMELQAVDEAYGEACARLEKEAGTPSFVEMLLRCFIFLWWIFGVVVLVFATCFAPPELSFPYCFCAVVVVIGAFQYGQPGIVLTLFNPNLFWFVHVALPSLLRGVGLSSLAVCLESTEEEAQLLPPTTSHSRREGEGEGGESDSNDEEGGNGRRNNNAEIYIFPRTALRTALTAMPFLRGPGADAAKFKFLLRRTPTAAAVVTTTGSSTVGSSNSSSSTTTANTTTTTTTSSRDNVKVVGNGDGGKSTGTFVSNNTNVPVQECVVLVDDDAASPNKGGEGSGRREGGTKSDHDDDGCADADAADAGVAVLWAGTEKERVVRWSDAECAICLCQYEDGEELRELPCNHHFHSSCIESWLKESPLVTSSMTWQCPLCKRSLLPSPGQLPAPSSSSTSSASTASQTSTIAAASSSTIGSSSGDSSTSRSGSGSIGGSQVEDNGPVMVVVPMRNGESSSPTAVAAAAATALGLSGSS